MLGIETVLLNISIELSHCKFLLTQLVQYHIVIHINELLSGGAGLIAAKTEPAGLQQHFAMPGICLIPKSIRLEPDDSVEDPHLLVAVRGDAQPALHLQVEDLTQLGFEPLEL